MKRIQIILAIVVVFFTLFFLFKNKEAQIVPQEAHAKTEAYIRARISELSPTKEISGGKFYVTEISFIDDQNGTVKYEDGHEAFVADFAYKVQDDGVQITNFKIRP